MPTESKIVDHDEIEANLRLHVDRLAGLIGPRTLKKPKTIQATIGYIEGQWTEMGYTNERECYDALGNEATNLIVERPGTKRSGEIVLLGAHYDTVYSTPGADDNASAVAVMLEVSRLLRQHTGRRTARYVAFACEEPPYFNVDAMGTLPAKYRGEMTSETAAASVTSYSTSSHCFKKTPPALSAK